MKTKWETRGFVRRKVVIFTEDEIKTLKKALAISDRIEKLVPDPDDSSHQLTDANGWLKIGALEVLNLIKNGKAELDFVELV